MIADAIINLASVLVRWIPLRFAIVHTYEQGVRWWFGHDTKLITKPGVYLYIPWIGDISVESVVAQEVETAWQCIMVNGRARSFSVGMQYEVVDLRKKLIRVDDFDESLLNLVERVAAKVMRDDTIMDPDKSILNRVRSRVEKWGVRIVELSIMNDARSRPLHHFVNKG